MDVEIRAVASVDLAACSLGIRRGIAEATIRTRAMTGVAATTAKIDMDARTAAADRASAATGRRTDPIGDRIADRIVDRAAGLIRAAATTDRPIRGIRTSSRIGTRISRRIVRGTIAALRRMNGARIANCVSVMNERSVFGRICGRAAKRVAARGMYRTRRILVNATHVIVIRANVIRVIVIHGSVIHAAAQGRSPVVRRMNGDGRDGADAIAVSSGVMKGGPIRATSCFRRVRRRRFRSERASTVAS